ncbi:MAG TPA: NAD-dependent epimerase/dehydratase family protein [Ktedonobacteraceae bacterium]|nr:NAD-dependent epimerase/dehydratase family protein [Ktedonobacteraceae bacterium]
MTVLITGGTGFIGAEVVRLLLDRGEQRPIVFHVSANTQRLGDVLDQIELVRGDLGNFNHILDVVKKVKPSVIYHLGATLSVPSEADPSSAIYTNAMGTFHVLEAARLFDVPQVLFSSSIGTYGSDIKGDAIDDSTIQRPLLMYGITKTFGEHLGLFYKRKYGLDYRCVRYPSIIGPGVKTPGAVQYTSWVIEECAKGKPFTIWARPETRVSLVYFKDAARAIVQLADAPLDNIKTVNYLLAGANPSASELADLVRARIPDARIDFQPDPSLQFIISRLTVRFDDSRAREEWGWEPRYTQDEMVDDFLHEMKEHPERYA